MNKPLLFLLLILLTLAPLAHSDTLNVGTSSVADDKFHLGIPLELENNEEGRAGAQPAEFRYVPLSEFANTLDRYRQKGGVLPDFDNPELEFFIYVPKKQYLAVNKKALVTIATDQIQKAFPKVTNPQIRFRFYETNEDALIQFSGRIGVVLNAFLNRFKDVPALRRYAAEMQAANKRALEEGIKFEHDQTTKPDFLDPPTVEKVKLGVSTVRLVALAGMRYAQVAPIFTHGSHSQQEWAYGLLIIDPAIEFFTVLFQRQVKNLLSRGPIPVINGALKVEVTRVVNSVFWGTLLFGNLRPYLTQWALHIADPKIDGPSIHNIALQLALTGIGATIYNAFLAGADNLQEKGWLAKSKTDLLIQGTGIFDVATNFLSSSTALLGYRWYTWTPQWLIYTLTYIAGRQLPVKETPIYAVHEDVPEAVWKHIKAERTNADAALHVDVADFEPAIKKLQNSKPLRFARGVSCSQAIASLKQRFKDLTRF